MTLLDDYEVPYKLRGVSLIAQMLETVPPDLLRRTGVDELIFSVCLQCCGRFQELIPATVPEGNAHFPT